MTDRPSRFVRSPDWLGMRLVIAAIVVALLGGPVHAEVQGTALGYGEFYEAGYAGGATGLVGSGAKAHSMFGMSFYERRGLVAKTIVGAPVFLIMLMVPAGKTSYLGRSSVHYYDIEQGYVGSTHTDYYLYTESQTDRDRKNRDIDSAVGAIASWPMTFTAEVVHEKLGSDVNGWFVALLPLGLMPRRGSGGPPILIDVGVSAGHLDPPRDEPMARDFDELAFALDVTFPVVRYFQLDIRQRVNFLGGHRGSFGGTVNLGNRVYARGGVGVDWAELSRPLGFRVEGGVRF
jgi:hypothetical protein